MSEKRNNVIDFESFKKNKQKSSEVSPEMPAEQAETPTSIAEVNAEDVTNIVFQKFFNFVKSERAKGIPEESIERYLRINVALFSVVGFRNRQLVDLKNFMAQAHLNRHMIHKNRTIYDGQGELSGQTLEDLIAIVNSSNTFMWNQKPAYYALVYEIIQKKAEDVPVSSELINKLMKK